MQILSMQILSMQIPSMQSHISSGYGLPKKPSVLPAESM